MPDSSATTKFILQTVIEARYLVNQLRDKIDFLVQLGVLPEDVAMSIRGVSVAIRSIEVTNAQDQS